MKYKLCSYPGCMTAILQPLKNCEKHKNYGKPFADAVRTNTHLYNTARWKRESADTIARHPWCARCNSTDRLTVDHKQAPRGDEVLFWEEDNREVLCHKCQAKKTAKEIHARKAQRVQSQA